MGAVEDGAREAGRRRRDCGRLRLEGAAGEGALEEEEDACEDGEGVEDDSSGWEGALLGDSKEEEESAARRKRQRLGLRVRGPPR